MGIAFSAANCFAKHTKRSCVTRCGDGEFDPSPRVRLQIALQFIYLFKQPSSSPVPLEIMRGHSRTRVAHPKFHVLVRIDWVSNKFMRSYRQKWPRKKLLSMQINLAEWYYYAIGTRLLLLMSVLWPYLFAHTDIDAIIYLQSFSYRGNLLAIVCQHRVIYCDVICW